MIRARVTTIANSPGGYVKFATLTVFTGDSDGAVRADASNETHITTISIPTASLEQITGEPPIVGQVYRLAMELEGA